MVMGYQVYICFMVYNSRILAACSAPGVRVYLCIMFTRRRRLPFAFFGDQQHGTAKNAGTPVADEAIAGKSWGCYLFPVSLYFLSGLSLNLRRLFPSLLSPLPPPGLHCIAFLQGTVLPTIGSDLDAVEAPEKASTILRAQRFGLRFV